MFGYTYRELIEYFEYKEIHDYIMRRSMRLHDKQRFLFRAFILNYVFVLIFWLVIKQPAILKLMSEIMHTGVSNTYLILMLFIGVWKIAGGVLFLIPGLVIWWERCDLKRKLKHLENMEK